MAYLSRLSHSFLGWGFTWSGSQLATASNTGNSIYYQYNDPDGMRSSKTVNGLTINYTTDANDNITDQTQSDGNDAMHFTYDSNGKLESMTLNGVKYTYETNAQVDVTGLIDSNGNEVVTYSYDSWGNLLGIGGSLASTVGALNPFRYKGYYYDTETSMYYLQSRYYNPELGRFISPDDPSYNQDYSKTNSTNLYTYANDNPVKYTDADGHTVLIPYPGKLIEYNPSKYSDSVKQIQAYLEKAYGYSLTPDGYFGSKTSVAVKDFQRNDPACGGTDGIVGQKTWDEIFKYKDTSEKTTPQICSNFLYNIAKEQGVNISIGGENVIAWGHTPLGLEYEAKIVISWNSTPKPFLSFSGCFSTSSSSNGISNSITVNQMNNIESEYSFGTGGGSFAYEIPIDKYVVPGYGKMEIKLEFGHYGVWGLQFEEDTIFEPDYGPTAELQLSLKGNTLLPPGDNWYHVPSNVGVFEFNFGAEYINNFYIGEGYNYGFDFGYEPDFDCA